MKIESPKLPDSASLQRPSRRWRWLRREAIDLGDVVVQIIAVVVGILLALFINNWSTQRQQQANVAEALQAMRAELAANRDQLRGSAAHLFAMAKAMQDSPANKNQLPRFCSEWDQWHGTGATNLVDAAYQISIATQALANMPFKHAELVSQTYGWQHLIQKANDFEVTLLIGRSQSLNQCVDLIVDIGNNDLQLDFAYSRLIGPDKAPLPKQPAAPPTQH